MFTELFQIALVAATLASGLVAGVFLTFSDFVMRALGRTAAPAAGLEAMQLINREVYRSQFMVLLIGLSLGAFALAAAGLVLAGGTVAAWLVAGALAYVGGVMAVTGLRNVPMNERLDREDPASPEALALWNDYLRDWTRWNHLRTTASAVAMLCYLAATVSFAGA